MSDALVSAVVQTVLGILSTAALQEMGLLWGLKDELNNLESALSTIHLVLQDAELKQRNNRALQNWLLKLKTVAYDVENVIDDLASFERGVNDRLRSFLSIRRNPLLFRLRMSRKVRGIRERLDAVAEERLKFHLRESVVETRVVYGSGSRRSCSLVDEMEVFGRGDEKEMIVAKLFGEMPDRDGPSVYAIWGMGGLGKTTLAQMVYNDERVERRFELRVWVCVSDDFSVERLLRAIVESVRGGGCDVSELDPLQRLVRDLLRGKRFLLVLDDVWNESYERWDVLREVLRCGLRGSVLIVTTRIEKVALMMATVAVHRIGYLSDDDSWLLFSQRAFASTSGKVEDEKLVAIGKAIVKKCGGVPLAIKALGSLMQFKSHEREWLAVKDSEIWHLSDDENGILPALRLSYDNLSAQMRQCFAYCCIFPKDYLMEENQLIQLWMANGFLLPYEGQADLPLTGHLIFKELIWRSLLQDVQINFMGNFSCKMHDLMHDLALSVMSHETCILEHGKALKVPKTLRHLSFVRGSSYMGIPDKRSKFKLTMDDTLRSLIVHEGNFQAWIEGLASFLSKQKYLRVLDLNRCFIDKLPNVVCKLEHLRYLTMSCNHLKRLPESLTHLHSLQTLKLTSSGELLELPKGLKVMKNLSFLEMETFFSLLCTPPGLGELTCLRGLSIFIVGQDAPHQIDQLKELNLEGELSIQGLDNVRNIEDAKRANLLAKSNLTSLSLSWTEGVKNFSADEHQEEVLEGLEPHRNLEKICIKSYQGSRFPNWMWELAFKSLKEIRLQNCQRCDRLPPFGKLPSLTCLNLFGLDSIKHLDADWHGDGERSFVALRDLSITSMPNLEKWTIAESMESFPCLEHLYVAGCPKLPRLPYLPKLTSLDLSSSNVALIGSITHLASLTSLSLSSFPELNVLPEGLLQNHKSLERLQMLALPIKTLSNELDSLSSLKALTLDSCSNLDSLPVRLKYLNSLEKLEICGHGQRSFPATILENLSSLRSLSFQNCEKLKPLTGPLLGTTGLQDLLINGCPMVEYLPDSLQQLRALRELRIWHCEGLCSLPDWLGSLESLSFMSLWYCENLNSLPDCFKNLKSLRQLEIRECPHLEKRCNKTKGEDWPKISHIRLIRVNYKVVQCLD